MIDVPPVSVDVRLNIDEAPVPPPAAWVSDVAAAAAESTGTGPPGS